MTKLYNTKSIENSVKDFDDKKGIVTGYFSIFGNKDKVGDIVAETFFTKSLKERGTLIPALFNHNWDNILSVPEVLKTDNKGLYYELNLLKTLKIGNREIDNPVAKTVLHGILEKIITKNSFGYRVSKSYRDSTGANVLTEGTLWEGSLLSMSACNDSAIVTGLKSFELDVQKTKLIELFDEILKMQKQKMTSEKLLIIRMKSLQYSTLLNDYLENKNIQPAEIATEPQTKDNQKEINNFYKLIKI